MVEHVEKKNAKKTGGDNAGNVDYIYGSTV